jgi:hypothetical protein
MAAWWCCPCNPILTRLETASTERGRSSGVEHNLAKVGVEGSNPFARSSFPLSDLDT